MDKCPVCGNTNQHELVTRFSYVGGQGYKPITECINSEDCWKRYDEQHGLTPATIKAQKDEVVNV